MKSKHFGVATALALLFTVGYFFGREVIETAWQRQAITWVEPQAGVFRVLGLTPGQSTFEEAVRALGGSDYFLQRTDEGFNIEFESHRYDEDELLFTVRVQPNTPGEKQTALLLEARASGLFSDEALASGRVPFTVLTDPGLTQLPVRKIEVLPAAPVTHDYVLDAHGKPDLASPVEGHDDGAEQAWVYTRKGAVIFFRDKEAVRFRYFDPTLLQSEDAPGTHL